MRLSDFIKRELKRSAARLTMRERLQDTGKQSRFAETRVGIYVIIRVMLAAHPRITIESGKRDGKPCIWGMRITVNDVLGWLARGMSEAEILDEHPGLEKDDFAAVYAFAADVSNKVYGDH
jgi:uncharacterized protein (DUF433 family)